MLDLNLFRDDRGGCVEFVKENQRRRFSSDEIVDEFVSLDEQWRASKCC